MNADDTFMALPSPTRVLQLGRSDPRADVLAERQPIWSNERAVIDACNVGGQRSFGVFLVADEREAMLSPLPFHPSRQWDKRGPHVAAVLRSALSKSSVSH